MGWRQIHDDVPVSASLNEVSHFAERLFWRLLSQTDSWGRLPGDREKIRAIAIPRLAVTDQELDSALEELVNARRISLYVVSEVWCCQVEDFDENQNIGRLRRAPSRYPPPPSAKPLLERGSAKTETEDREDRSLPTAVARDPARGLPVDEEIRASLSEGAALAASGVSSAGGDVMVDDLTQLAASLRGADDGTVRVLRKLQAKGAGEREFAMAVESLHHRRSRTDRAPLQSEVRYVVATLTTMLQERGGDALSA